MTTNRDDNPPPIVHRPDPQKGQQVHERAQQVRQYRDGEELNPRDDLGQASERTQSQGRSDEDDRG